MKLNIKTVVALAIPIVGLIELGVYVWGTKRAPSTEQWLSIKPAVKSLYQPGDLVVIAPRWAEPHGRMALGELMPLREIARPDETRYSRAIEISAVGQRLPELENWSIAQEQSVAGNIKIRVLNNPKPAHVVTDFVDRIEQGQATVFYQLDRQDTPCPFRTQETVSSPGLFGHPTMPAKRFVCGKDPWQSVGVTVQEDNHYYARRCVWSHPPQNGVTVIQFPNADLGDEIRGHMGIHWTLEREQRGAPVNLEILVENELIGVAQHVDGQTWEKSLFSFSTGRFANSRAQVTFRVVTNNANERHFCWEADSR